eukprot:COSAG04_NODE_736_length_10705_cov_17.817273_6_plen_242_part_00
MLEAPEATIAPFRAEVAALRAQGMSFVAERLGRADQALPEGTRICVAGRGRGVYVSFTRKLIGDNEHTIRFDGGPPVALKLWEMARSTHGALSTSSCDGAPAFTLGRAGPAGANCWEGRLLLALLPPALAFALFSLVLLVVAYSTTACYSYTAASSPLRTQNFLISDIRHHTGREAESPCPSGRWLPEGGSLWQCCFSDVVHDIFSRGDVEWRPPRRRAAWWRARCWCAPRVLLPSLSAQR